MTVLSGSYVGSSLPAREIRGNSSLDIRHAQDQEVPPRAWAGAAPECPHCRFRLVSGVRVHPGSREKTREIESGYPSSATSRSASEADVRSPRLTCCNPC